MPGGIVIGISYLLAPVGVTVKEPFVVPTVAGAAIDENEPKKEAISIFRKVAKEMANAVFALPIKVEVLVINLLGCGAAANYADGRE